MPTIRTLSQSMINKIAAGEVIERPASVIKELVENSIDAGATRIDVSVENGGADLLQIVDNGCGIAPDQLPLAISPHATSKLADTDDLFHIATFGFRGEALASIAEISQLSIKSRTADHNGGAMIQSNGGDHSDVTSCGLPVGTQIEAKNLIFNTPVRRRYMKSTTTEFGHVTETFIRLVLPQPAIHFTLKHNSRTVHNLPPTDDPLSRIRQLFGEEVARDLLAVESPPSAAVRVTGYVSHPNQSRPTNRMQYFFLNHRYIRDRSLQHALHEAYRGILLGGRFPLAFLQIELSPEMFDVNVHPTKMEVRFLDTNRVYSGFLSAIRERFLTSDLRNKIHSVQKPESAGGTASPQNQPSTANQHADDPRTAMDDSAVEKTRQTVNDWISQIPKQAENVTKSDLPKREYDSYRQPRDNLSIHRLPDRPAPSLSSAPAAFAAPPMSATSPNVPLPEDRVAFSPEGHLVVQMLHRYLVMETAEGIAFVDQHAMHERILYEKLKEKMNGGMLESQRLLVPVPVDLAPNELACVLENLAFFKTLGLSVEPFGGNTVLISAFPAILSKTPPTEILLSQIEPFLESGKKLEQGELLDELLHSMACKAAVKAGEKLSSESMRHLIALAEAEINSHHCPHGRPSTLIFTQAEIDKMFKRI
jgi:DNA mismatch repair protein MutL